MIFPKAKWHQPFDPFPRKNAAKAPRKSEEHDNQSAFFQILALKEKEYPMLKFVFAMQSGAFLSFKTSKKEKRAGMKKGVPDVCIPIQSRGFGGAWIENKSEKGRLRPEQKEFIEHLEKNNYCVKVCYSFDDAIEFIEWYLEIKLVEKTINEQKQSNK